tara:strand:+ start:152 stop:349 length:198 start_codon:yes stop_codon:yes gene_type:complete
MLLINGKPLITNIATQKLKFHGLSEFIIIKLIVVVDNANGEREIALSKVAGSLAYNTRIDVKYWS